MFCPKCGNPLPANARFCSLCGVAVRSNASSGMESPLGSSSFENNDFDAARNSSNPYATPSETAPYAPSGWDDVADVPDYLIWNVLSTLFCCTPVGIAGIIFSIQTNSAKARGDVEGAARHSSTAKTLLIVGLVCGGLQVLLSFLWIAFSVMFEIGSLGAF